MQTTRTIRNGLPVFRRVCPQRWSEVTSTDQPEVRPCDQCDLVLMSVARR
jgi:hypothetical protein